MFYYFLDPVVKPRHDIGTTQQCLARSEVTWQPQEIMMRLLRRLLHNLLAMT
ncbi:MAG TPA: hypothetical protein LFV90_05765 [Rickettsia endosymbiont of Columbicola hoogstraali]|nr:hypothetical protein [Rickettsia endosymbiont of Columbicola hoogstraali]